MTRSRLVLPTYLTAEALSSFGNAAIQVALPWLVLLRTGNPAAAGAVAAVAGVAQIAATFAVGQLIDRFGARRMAVIADVGSALSVAALAIIDAAGVLTIGLTMVLAAAGALFDVPGMTARQTLMRRISERSGVRLDTVAGLRQGVFGLSFLVGPALAGILLALLAPGQVLWITAGCSALAAVVTRCIRVAPINGDGAEQGIRGAWRTVRRSEVLVKLLVVASMASLIGAPLLSVLLPAHFAALDRPDLLGFALSSFAVGLVVGAGLFAVLGRMSRRLVWVLAIVASTLGLVLIAILGGFALIAVGAVVLGVGSGLVNPLFGAVISERVPGSQLGRVMGLSNALAMVAGPVGLGLAAFAVGVGGLAALAWGLVVVWMLIGLYALNGRVVRELDARPVEEDGGTEFEEAVDAHHQPAR